MPPKVKITKEKILSAAVELVRKRGADAINARAVADELGVSTQPIFSNYATMDELKKDVIAFAEKLYLEYTEKEMSSGKYPVYKGSGMAYICFAKQEKELFKMLFMCDRSDGSAVGESEKMNRCVNGIVDIVQEGLGVERDDAFLFHVEMWVFVHGIATMCATGYLELDDETISRMTSDMYLGLRTKYARET